MDWNSEPKGIAIAVTRDSDVTLMTFNHFFNNR
ncbi:hypothetical protein J2S77_000170 [Alkalibacillus salilacus]|uniref:Uncharacterized protein n=1 Tax=Alkalibacillus salilacus TaxID=284582 RepID=A0ABT9VBM9_9BACI|nr:hypothetical protein [Alkalibacillus salilacus]